MKNAYFPQQSDAICDIKVASDASTSDAYINPLSRSESMQDHTVSATTSTVNPFTPLTIKTTAAIIHLSKGMHALVDAADFDVVSRYFWNPIQANTGKFYVCRKASEENPYGSLHRFLMQARRGEVVDHWDRNPLNNRRENLRVCTHQQNVWNRSADRRSGSGFKGVHFFKPTKRWQAHIRVNNKKIHLGYFPTVEDAARAYDAAAIEHFGEYAKTNFNQDKTRCA
jgi:hypothetical protein